MMKKSIIIPILAIIIVVIMLILMQINIHTTNQMLLDTKELLNKQQVENETQLKQQHAENMRLTQENTQLNTLISQANSTANLALSKFPLPPDYFTILSSGDGWTTQCCEINDPTCPPSHPKKAGSWYSIQNGGKCGYCSKFSLCMK